MSELIVTVHDDALERDGPWIERLSEKGGRVLRTNLDRKAEGRIRRGFEKAYAGAMALQRSDLK